MVDVGQALKNRKLVAAVASGSLVLLTAVLSLLLYPVIFPPDPIADPMPSVGGEDSPVAVVRDSVWSTMLGLAQTHLRTLKEPKVITGMLVVAIAVLVAVLVVVLPRQQPEVPSDPTDSDPKDDPKSVPGVKPGESGAGAWFSDHWVHLLLTVMLLALIIGATVFAKRAAGGGSNTGGERVDFLTAEEIEALRNNREQVMKGIKNRAKAARQNQTRGETGSLSGEPATQPGLMLEGLESSGDSTDKTLSDEQLLMLGLTSEKLAEIMMTREEAAVVFYDLLYHPDTSEAPTPEPGMTPGRLALGVHGITYDPKHPQSQQLRVPTGLTNVGNTCFLATVMQCLAWMLAPLEKVFKERFGSDPDANLKKDFKFVFCKVITELQAGKQFKRKDMEALRDALVGLKRNFKLGASGDVGEVLQVVLEQMEGDDLLNEAIVRPLYVEETTTKTCLEGHPFKSSVEPSLVFRLNAVPGCRMVQDILGVQTKATLKEAGNLAKCSDCNGQQVKVMETVRYTTSDIIAVQRRMSQYNIQNVNSFLEFPTGQLQVGDTTYHRMEAFMYYSLGHYISCMRMPEPSDLWFCANDYYVTKHKGFPEFANKEGLEGGISIAFYR